MKKLNLIVTLLFSFLYVHSSMAQSEAAIKLENNKYYISYIKDYIFAMQSNTDSVRILEMLTQMQGLADQISIELDNMIVEQEAEIIYSEEVPEQSYDDSTIAYDYNWPEQNTEYDYQNKDDNFGVNQLFPFKNIFNTKLVFQFGLNGLHQKNSNVSGFNYPEVNTGGSWFWEFGLSRKIQLGGKDSKVDFNYGLSYQINRFKWEDDLRLTTTSGNPVFINESELTSSSRLSVMYLTLPLSFKFNLSKNFSTEWGVYAGYRIRSIQDFHRKEGADAIHEMRYSAWELNNWMYGFSGSIGLGAFNLIGKYNISNIFRDNPAYDYNTFMIGTSFRF